MSGPDVEQALASRIRRLNVITQGIVIGLLGGLALLLATAWLLIRGGDPVGPHLSLLGVYFPGYAMTWPGALLGGLYGFVTGFVIGAGGAAIYNRVSAWRNRGG